MHRWHSYVSIGIYHIVSVFQLQNLKFKSVTVVISTISQKKEARTSFNRQYFFYCAKNLNVKSRCCSSGCARRMSAVGKAQNSSEAEKNHKHPKCHRGKLEKHCFLSDQDNFTSIFQTTHMLDICSSLFLSEKDKLPPSPICSGAGSIILLCSLHGIFREQTN